MPGIVFGSEIILDGVEDQVTSIEAAEDVE